MATIVVFASSFFLTVVMFVMKAVELKYKRKSFLLGIINKLEFRCEKLTSFIKFKTLQLIQSVRYLIQVEIKKLSKEWLCKIQQKIEQEYKAKQEVIMGHKEITNRGSASFYLKKIMEGKGDNGKGKIEETL